MNFLKSISRGIDALNLWVGRFVAWSTALVVMVVFVDVVMRYAFNKSFVFTQEMEWHLFSFIFLMGAGYTLYTKGHIRIDLLYMKFPPRGRALIDVVGYLVIFFPIMFILVVSSFDMAKDAYEIREVSQFTPWQPILWPFKSVICVGFSLLILQGIAEFLRSVIQLIKGDAL